MVSQSYYETEVTSIVRLPARIHYRPHRWFSEQRMTFDEGFRRHDQRATIYFVSTIATDPSWCRTARMQALEAEQRDAKYMGCAVLPWKGWKA